MLLGFEIPPELEGEAQQIKHRDVRKGDLMRCEGYVEGENDDPPTMPDHLLYMIRDDRLPVYWFSLGLISKKTTRGRTFVLCTAFTTLPPKHISVGGGTEGGF